AIPWWWAIVAIVSLVSFGGGYFTVKHWGKWPRWGESGPLEADESFEAPFLADCQASLRRGDRGEAVRELQEQLQQLGVYDSTVDGRFGPGTEVAVAAFQRQHGLAADAIAGCETQRAMQAAIAER
ncbi:MAG: peptidoglycan-binding domain-containing protein, partial [Cyanobacteria bacterium J06641_5]